MTMWRSSTQTGGRRIAAGLAVAMLTLAMLAGQAQAAPLAVEPRDILLTADDLPEGFKVDPRYCRE